MKPVRLLLGKRWKPVTCVEINYAIMNRIELTRISRVVLLNEIHSYLEGIEEMLEVNRQDTGGLRNTHTTSMCVNGISK